MKSRAGIRDYHYIRIAAGGGRCRSRLQGFFKLIAGVTKICKYIHPAGGHMETLDINNLICLVSQVLPEPVYNSCVNKNISDLAVKWRRGIDDPCLLNEDFH